VQDIRKTRTLCPDCGRELEGRVVVEDGKAYLDRNCPEHGPYRFLLSRHGAWYADLDRFFFEVLDGGIPKGRITNYWILSTAKCQQHCLYCGLEVQKPFYDEMPIEALREAIEQYGSAKLTFADGEPTLHPQVLQFFREAWAKKVATQLATNGVRLASREFCLQLADAHVTEVRISYETLDPKQSVPSGTSAFWESKYAGLRNLIELGIPTILSPTIFKGINEDQLIASLEFARDKPIVRELSVNGFAWNGSGLSIDKDLMIMPDEMMDVLFARYFDGDREAIFTFQKTMLAILQIVGIRLCLYTQLMLFVRDKTGLVPFTRFLNMRRLKQGITWWERFSKAARFTQAVALAWVLFRALDMKSLRLLPTCLRLFAANLFQIAIHRYPSKLLPVVLNTNCSTLSADNMVSARCMSGCLYVRDGTLHEGLSTSTLLDKEKETRNTGSRPVSDASHRRDA